MNVDCSVFYCPDGKLRSWEVLPTWYVQFLASSPPTDDIKNAAVKELKSRGVDIMGNAVKRPG